MRGPPRPPGTGGLRSGAGDDIFECGVEENPSLDDCIYLYEKSKGNTTERFMPTAYRGVGMVVLLNSLTSEWILLSAEDVDRLSGKSDTSVFGVYEDDEGSMATTAMT